MRLELGDGVGQQQPPSSSVNPRHNIVIAKGVCALVQLDPNQSLELTADLVRLSSTEIGVTLLKWTRNVFC